MYKQDKNSHKPTVEAARRAFSALYTRLRTRKEKDIYNNYNARRRRT